MDALKLAVRRLSLLLALAMLAAAPLSICHAAGDGTTLCRWSRIWHGPNSIWRPLTPYFMPRPADPCLYGGYGRSCYEDASFAYGCGFAAEGQGRYIGEDVVRYEGESLAGYGEAAGVSVGLERLGQIPNEMGIAGGGAGVAPAARPGR
jgi:hypothetical protein